MAIAPSKLPAAEGRDSSFPAPRAGHSSLSTEALAKGEAEGESSSRATPWVSRVNPNRGLKGRNPALASICFALLLFAASTGRAEPHRLKILTTILPVYCFTANVAGDLADVENLLPPGAEPHEFQFSPRELKKVNAANVMVISGLGLESWLDRVLKSPEQPKVVVEAFAGLDGAVIRQESYLSLGESGAAAKDLAANPHAWLDPHLAAHAVTNILMALQKADPTNASAYERNAAAYVTRLKALDSELSTGLEPLHGRPVITYHDAFPYFARRYGLKVVGVIEKVPDLEPSPSYLVALGKVMKEQKVQLILAEKQSSARLAEQIGHDHGVAVATLDTVETGEMKPGAYEEAMRSNLEVLVKALGEHGR